MASKNVKMLSFKPLHPTFGAECFGIDFAKPLAEDTVDELRMGMAKYGVIVFRSTAMDDSRHEAFARQFGEPDTSAVNPIPMARHRLAPHMELTDAGNLDSQGNLAKRDSLRFQLNRGNGNFHVDCSYNARRAGYSILRAHKLPPSGQGGGTAFADTRTAYDDLDASKKCEIENLALWHSILHSRKVAAPDCEILSMVRAEDLPMACHKLAQLHEPSGRMNLYIASHAHHIDGRSGEESRPLIEHLLTHASQPKYVFTVDWQNSGDVVMWVSLLKQFSSSGFISNAFVSYTRKDNTCVMHRAAGGSFEGRFVRDMRRATVYDSSSTAYGLNTFWSRVWQRVRLAAAAIIHGKINLVKFYWKIARAGL